MVLERQHMAAAPIVKYPSESRSARQLEAKEKQSPARSRLGRTGRPRMERDVGLMGLHD